MNEHLKIQELEETIRELKERILELENELIARDEEMEEFIVSKDREYEKLYNTFIEPTTKVTVLRMSGGEPSLAVYQPEPTHFVVYKKLGFSLDEVSKMETIITKLFMEIE